MELSGLLVRVMPPMLKRCLGPLSLAALIAIAHADAPRFPAKATTKPPTLDGTITDSEWSDAVTFEGLQEFSTRQAAPDAAKFWLAYDSQYIYFAAKLADPQPSRIQANEYRSNVSLDGDDSVTLSLDLGGSLSDFSEFGFNPRGATSINLAGGRAAKKEWTGEVLSQARLTPEGWEVEARIPWKVLSLPAPGPRAARFNVQRSQPWRARRYIFRTPVGGRQDDTPFWENVVIPSAPVDRSIKFLPYSYLGYDPDTRGIANFGVDIKTKIADQSTLVGSISPDFRNVENQILSLDFSRFERLAGESRPFFQEGSQYFESALFASQRITRFDAAVSGYGKIGDRLQYGILNANDFGDKNSFVSNFSYNPSTSDSVRFSATSLRERGVNNDAYMVRYAKSMGPVSFSVRRMGSKDTTEGQGSSNEASVDFYQDGTWLGGGFEQVGPDFQPRLGFVPERNLRGAYFGTSKVWRWNTGPIGQYGSQILYRDYDRVDGSPYRRALNLDAFAITRSRLLFNVNSEWSRYLGSNDRLTRLVTVFPANDPYRSVSLDYSFGNFDGSKYDSVSLSTSYRPVQDLQLTSSIQSVRFNGLSEQAILGFNYDLKQDRSLTGRVVKAGKDTNAYVAFRRSGNQGMEYYLIVGDPNARTFRSSVILKLIFPFQIG
ncbi:MAG: sugar-binding protein [Fimbriimonas sp.]